MLFRSMCACMHACVCVRACACAWLKNTSLHCLIPLPYPMYVVLTPFLLKLPVPRLLLPPYFSPPPLRSSSSSSSSFSSSLLSLLLTLLSPFPPPPPTRSGIIWQVKKSHRLWKTLNNSVIAILEEAYQKQEVDVKVKSLVVHGWSFNSCGVSCMNCVAMDTTEVWQLVVCHRAWTALLMCCINSCLLVFHSLCLPPPSLPARRTTPQAA